MTPNLKRRWFYIWPCCAFRVQTFFFLNLFYSFLLNVSVFEVLKVIKSESQVAQNEKEMTSTSGLVMVFGVRLFSLYSFLFFLTEGFSL